MTVKTLTEDFVFRFSASHHITPRNVEVSENYGIIWYGKYITVNVYHDCYQVTWYFDEFNYNLYDKTDEIFIAFSQVTTAMERY